MTFEHIYLDSFCVEENEFYSIYYSPDTLYMYDDNFLQLHYQPSLEEFKVIEQNLLDFREDAGWDHLKIIWPQDAGLSPEVTNYLAEKGYGLEMLELYTVQPSDFSPSYIRPEVTVQPVTEDTLPLFKQLSFDQDEEINETFAKQKQALYDRLFEEGNVTLVLAFIEDNQVGGVSMIEAEETVEIDSLFVVDNYQRQGIGAAIQQYVMDTAGKRRVILVADADDSPREMYRKQGYRYEGFQIGAVKELRD